MQQTNNHTKPTLFLPILAVLILCCSVSVKISDSNYYLLKIPPNVVKITDNLFCDRTEIDNVSWREYMYWTKSVFGNNSPEYSATVPDTLVWKEAYSCLEPFTDYYLKHATYRWFPVVGITQQQAINFSKWRSDRWFEKLLIDMNKIGIDSTQNKDTYFTIEKYFNGTFGKINGGEKVKYYPNFRLPTLAERQQIIHYADSVDKAYLEKCNSKYCKDCKANFPKFQSDIIPCIGDTFKVEPTVSTYSHFSAKKGSPIYNLRGNVSEWALEENVTLGGGWFNKRENVLQADTFHITKQNAWTGFRNICEWKEWKE